MDRMPQKFCNLYHHCTLKTKCNNANMLHKCISKDITQKTSTITAGVPFSIALRTVSRVLGPPSSTTQTTGTWAASADDNVKLMKIM